MALLELCLRTHMDALHPLVPRNVALHELTSRYYVVLLLPRLITGLTAEVRHFRASTFPLEASAALET